MSKKSISQRDPDLLREFKAFLFVSIGKYTMPKEDIFVASSQNRKKKHSRHLEKILPVLLAPKRPLVQLRTSQLMAIMLGYRAI